MPSAIPIKNIYYLLCYAWDRLEQGQLVDIDQASTTELPDLFALVLCEGVRQLARRGLEQGYECLEDEISGVRGRIDISQSIRRSLFMRGRLYCAFDELTSNTLANRIIKSTLRALKQVSELQSELKKRVHSTHRDLRGIDEIALTTALLKKVQVNSNSRFYRFLLNTCELIHESLFIDEQSGTTRFRDFVRDDAKMAKLFESFLFNFITRECPQWVVRRENLRWRATSETDPALTLLPDMKTDISLKRPGEYLIVDAKYYREAFSSYFDAEKIRSGHLYQLMSYLLNAHNHDSALAGGMLIYPRVDRTIREQYEILGRQVSICTIDLGRPWPSIHSELRELLH